MENTQTGSGPRESDEAVLRRSFAGARVLLVEDEPINRVIVEEYLHQFGLVPDGVPNGQVALDRCASAAYDVVLMDMRMPVMDGVEAARRIRGLPRGADLPIIAMTANAYAEDRAACREAGMNDFLCKPFELEDLAAVLLKWLGNGRSRAP